MNINNPTLAHFRHFSPLFTNFPTTNVEKPLQIRPFLCKTNPIFRIFRLKSMISLKNKPNSNPIQTQTKPILSRYGLYQSQTKPKQTQSSLSSSVVDKQLNTEIIKTKIRSRK
jgi:hypothetical protein